MPSIDEARQHLGQLIMTGFTGLDLSDDAAAFISQADIGGVILFAANYESPAQLGELTNAIQECRGDLPLWIAADHEGGRVQRFKKPFTRIPSAAVIGKSDSPKMAFDFADGISKELKAVGVNVNFAPVADIMTNAKNPVIGDRAFGDNEEIVSKMVTGFVRGHLVNSVQSCVKHFPGHGDTSIDSHLALPKVDTDLETLRSREFRPFVRAFKSRCSMVMTAHILNSKIDPDFPATLSVKTIQDILRKDLRFSKVVFTDDMEMKAITDHYGADHAPVLAVQAGCDILVYRTEAGARHAYEVLIKALETGKVTPERVMESVERITLLKKEFLLPYAPVSVSEVTAQIGLQLTQELADKFESMARR